MALVKCQECGNEVSTEAASCPKCGAPVKISKSALSKAQVILGLMIGIGVIWWLSASSVNQSAPPASHPIGDTNKVDVATATPTCETDYRKCKDNEDLVNNFQEISKAQVACKMATDDHVAYGNPDWGGLMSIPFGYFVPGNDALTTGAITLLDRTVQIQNAFGAMVHSSVSCRYNLRNDKISSLAINGEIVIEEAVSPQEGSSTPVASTQASISSDSTAAPNVDRVVPSFDCTKAHSVAEKLICTDQTLADKDNELASLYKEARNTVTDKKGFDSVNRAEWMDREAKCHDKDCLLAWYSHRKSQLEEIISASAN